MRKSPPARQGARPGPHENLLSPWAHAVSDTTEDNPWRMQTIAFARKNHFCDLNVGSVIFVGIVLRGRLHVLFLYLLTTFYGLDKTKKKWQIWLDISLIKPIFDAKAVWLSTGRKHYPGLMTLAVEQSSWYSYPWSQENVSQITFLWGV